MTIFEATGVEVSAIRPSTQYVAQFTCTGFNNTTRQGSTGVGPTADGWYKVNVENKTSTSWAGTMCSPHHAIAGTTTSGRPRQ